MEFHNDVVIGVGQSVALLALKAWDNEDNILGASWRPCVSIMDSRIADRLEIDWGAF